MSKQQRRKGNAKNASSASAHGYLSQDGSTLVGLTPEVNIFEVASNNLLHQVSEIDDETRIVMKKLTKKDCQTREKGLKELIEMIKLGNNCIESSYEHFSGLVPQLSTDGSPTVRMLTMKVIATFLIKLKKAAAKGLKKIIPMVLFAKSDGTNGVAAAATAVIREGFELEKKKQLIQLFSPLTFEIAVNILLDRSDLSAPTEYDATEDKDTRRSRLETQALNVFLSYIKEFGSESKIWEDHARKLFEKPEFMKKVFSGNKESVKVQLLNICYGFEDRVKVMMSNTQIIAYIQNALDAQTFSSECATSWEGLLMLLPSEEFQTKVSLQKGVYPRFLNVIRKKGNHWRVIKHYFLPVFANLLREFKSTDAESKIITSVLESFMDKLPWQSEVSLQAVHCWFHTFSDFVRWILSKHNLESEVKVTVMSLTVRMTEQAMFSNTGESIEHMTGLLYWIVDNQKLHKKNIQELTSQIQLKIVEAGQEKSRLLKEALTKSGKHIELSDLHAFLLSNPELTDFHIIKNLANAEEDYLNATLKKLKDFSFIEDTDKFDMNQAGDVVRLITKILENKITLKMTVKNNYVGRRLLLSANENVWNNILEGSSTELFQDMINHWHEKRNGKAIADAVSFLKSKDIVLDTGKATENVDFLITLLKKIEIDSTAKVEDKSVFVFKLFSALFDSDDEPSQEHYETMRNYLNDDFHHNDFFEKLFSSNEENEFERVLEIAARFDKLIGLCPDHTKTTVLKNLLLTPEKYNDIFEKLRFLELDVFAFSMKSTLMLDAFANPIVQLDEQETTNLVKELARIALFNVASDYHMPLHQGFGWLMIRVISSLEERYCLKTLDGELTILRDEIKKRVIRSDEVRKALLDGSFSNFIVDIYDISFEQNVSLHCAAIGKCEETSNKVEDILSTSDTPLEFMEDAFKNSSTTPLFQFDQSNNFNWFANLHFAKQFLSCGENIFNVENLELRDFALCGIVSVLDNAADVLADSPHAFEENPRLEALIALYMKIFMNLDNSVKKGNETEQTAEEWNEFYAPTISIYLIRLFRSIRKDQQPTPFVKVLSNVMFSLKTFPAEVPNDDNASREFVPELSAFQYSPIEESCISHAFSLFSSSVESIQLIGYAVSKLLMPIMFKTENEKSLKVEDETEVNVSSRPKLSLPVMISKSYPKDHTHRHVGPLLLDLALIPLQDSSLTQEQRVAYCDAIDQFFRNAMNNLMLDQPFEFNQTPISCRIPKTREREYYLTEDLSATPVFFDKFASRLLFKSITLLPAAVRLFYKGMPNCFMSIFQEVVTKYASKLLIEQELSKVSAAKFEGMKVRTVPVTGEIIAEYVIEETKMKLTIELSSDYPLAVPTMKLDKAIVKTDKAKKWLLQLNAYLFHQNGAILEGIEMWKRNVDKGVEGVEDCTICMMTIHQQTHQLPKVRCKQCKNKFHSNCLYKWFESSNQSTCPLCRNNFT